MTSQEKKKFLNLYRILDKRIDQKCEDLSRWRSRAEKITPRLSCEPRGGDKDGNQVEQAVEKIVALEAEINALIDEMQQPKYEIMRAIESVQDETLKLLLTYRYINGNTFEQIAVKMNYSWRQVIRLHGKALLQISDNVIECHIDPVI